MAGGRRCCWSEGPRGATRSCDEPRAPGSPFCQHHAVRGHIRLRQEHGLAPFAVGTDLLPREERPDPVRRRREVAAAVAAVQAGTTGHVARLRAAADARAERLRPLVVRLIAEGARGAQGLARALNTAGARTISGSPWHPRTAERLAQRLGLFLPAALPPAQRRRAHEAERHAA